MMSWQRNTRISLKDMQSVSTFHQRGNILHIGTFKNPSKELFDLWWGECINTIDMSSYKVFLYGSFIDNNYRSNTDIDIAITGGEYDPDRLTDIMREMFSIGVKYDLLIDVFYYFDESFIQKDFKGDLRRFQWFDYIYIKYMVNTPYEKRYESKDRTIKWFDNYKNTKHRYHQLV